MAIPARHQGPDSSINASSKSQKTGKPASLSLRGPVGPLTDRGKQRSSYNAVKHGIFAVGLVRNRESRAQYQKIVTDMFETLQPVGRLEEILVEKLAMSVWRYRRLLQAEAAEVEREAESVGEENPDSKLRAAVQSAKDIGFIGAALTTQNEAVLELALQSLRELRQLIDEKGLDWERDRDALVSLYGTEKKDSRQITVLYVDKPRPQDEPCLGSEQVRKYRELAFTDKDQRSETKVSADAVKLLVSMLDEEIKGLHWMLGRWRIWNEIRSRLRATTALVPQREVADRLQRYEASLERSFDRTLSQLERLQRLRLGQPVLPALKVDVSH